MGIKFTNEKLLNLEEDIANGVPYKRIFFTDLTALLHRLKCAETHIERSVCDPDTTSAMWNTYKAWKESKGEDAEK